MMEFFEFALSGFWTFVGVFMLTALFCRAAVRMVVGSLSALRGTPVQFGSTFGTDDAKRAVKEGFSEGAVDAEIARAQVRNRQRMA